MHVMRCFLVSAAASCARCSVAVLHTRAARIPLFQAVLLDACGQLLLMLRCEHNRTTALLSSGALHCTQGQPATNFLLVPQGRLASGPVDLVDHASSRSVSGSQETLHWHCLLNATRVADERSGNRAGKDKGQTLTVFPAFDSAASMEHLLPPQLLRALQTAESITAGR
jgi:hypothetical protein